MDGRNESHSRDRQLPRTESEGIGKASCAETSVWCQPEAASFDYIELGGLGACRHLCEYVVCKENNGGTFDHFILFLILLNCAATSLSLPAEPDDSLWNRRIVILEDIFLVLFTIELLLKLVAYGWRQFFKNAWNVLDVVVISMGWLASMPHTKFATVNSLRVVRVLKPLRTIKSFPVMRRMVVTIFNSLPYMGNVLVLAMYLLLFFGVLGVQLFNGKFFNRCAKLGSDGQPIVADGDFILLSQDQLCSRSKSLWHGYHCPSGYVCLEVDGITSGFKGFNNIGWALLTIFQCITLEGWVDVMYMAQDTTVGWSLFYFISIVFFGSFFLVNLLLAVITVTYNNVIEKEEAKGDPQQPQISPAMASEFNLVGQSSSQEIHAHYASEIEMVNPSENPASSGAQIPGARREENINFHAPAANQCSLFREDGKVTAGKPEGEPVAPAMRALRQVNGRLVRRFVFRKWCIEEDGCVGNHQQLYDYQQVKTQDAENYQVCDRAAHRGLSRWNYIPEVIGAVEASIHIVVTWVHSRAFLSKSWWNNHRASIKQLMHTLDKISKVPYLSRWCRCLIQRPEFDKIIRILIILNTLVLALDYHGSPYWYFHTLEVINSTLANLFILEMMVRLLAMGVTAYMKSGFKRFDFVVNIISLIEMCLYSSTKLSALRSLRVLRIFQLFQKWESLQKFLRTLRHTLDEFGNYCLIVLFTIFIFASLGMQLFGGKFRDQNGDVPRMNFDNMFWAMLAVFQTLTGEDWPNLMEVSIREIGALSSLYFVSLVIVGDFIVMNLFMAILLSNFSVYSEDQGDFDARLSNVVIDGSGTESSIASQDQSSLNTEGRRRRRGPPLSKETSTAQEKWEMATIMAVSSTLTPDMDEDQPRGSPLMVENAPEAIREEQPGGIDRDWQEQARVVVQHRWFTLASLVMLCLYSIVIAMERPEMSKDRRWDITFYVCNAVFTSLLAVEVALKIAAHGLWNGESAFLKNGWSHLEILTLLGSILHLLVHHHGALILRASCLLNIINRVPEIKIVLRVLMKSFSGLGGSLLVSAVFWTIFGVLGMMLFMGKLHFCNDPLVMNHDECVGEMEDGRQRVWENSRSHFDDILHALMTLLEMSTTEGWVDVMIKGIDAEGVDRQPRKNAHPEKALFFVVYMIIGAMFLINLFVGLMMDNFATMRDREGGNLFTTQEQKQWFSLHKRLLQMRIVMTMKQPSGLRGKIYAIVNSRAFEIWILCLIMLNVIFMMTDGYGISSRHKAILEVANQTFMMVFALEAALKIYAMRFFVYLLGPWNAFDFLIVCVSVLSWICGSSSDMVVFRIIRIARALRLIHQLQSLRVMLDTLFRSIPTMLNVGGLILIMIFWYSVVGMCFFGRIGTYHSYLTVHANFKNVGYGMVTLLRMLTGEGWNGIMADCMVKPPHCCAAGSLVCPQPHMAPGDCGSMWAPLYFFSFAIFGTFILLNLFLAIVLENYSSGSDLSLVDETHLLQFKHLWQEFDPDASGFLRTTDLVSFLRELPPPLGTSSGQADVPTVEVMSLIRELEVKTTAVGTQILVFYQDVLHALLCRLYGISMHSIPDGASSQIYRKLEKRRSSNRDRQIRVFRKELMCLKRTCTLQRESSLTQSVDGQRNDSYPLQTLLRLFSRSRRNPNLSSTAPIHLSHRRIDRAIQSLDLDNLAVPETAEYDVVAHMIQSRARNATFKRRFGEYYLLTKLEKEIQETKDLARDIIGFCDKLSLNGEVREGASQRNLVQKSWKSSGDLEALRERLKETSQETFQKFRRREVRER
ncbi:hypothetical protein BSKO_01505 [Bryopsis sp. KO-2023]|nr:hypothetical protein BSKO_01505 [Bryopsis sp. KO-2023]